MEKKVMLDGGKVQVPCWVSAPNYGEIRRVVLGVHGLGGSAIRFDSPTVDEIIPENFNSVAAMVAMVDRLKG